MDKNDFSAGCHGDLEQWMWLNDQGAFLHDDLSTFVSPTPPPELMSVTTGVLSHQNFGRHGVTIYTALHNSAVHPLLSSNTILDFGCGCGRLARMFKGFRGHYHGCDIDLRLVTWVKENLPFVKTDHSSVKPPLPYKSNYFNTIISVSIFSHLKEFDQDLFLKELARITSPGGQLLLTIHGERALRRAQNESKIFDMISVDAEKFNEGITTFAANKHVFIRQEGHLTTMPIDSSKELVLTGKAIVEPYEYGISFIPESYIYDHWSKYFKVIKIVKGGIHDFQDIVVLTKE